MDGLGGLRSITADISRGSVAERGSSWAWQLQSACTSQRSVPRRWWRGGWWLGPWADKHAGDVDIHIGVGRRASCQLAQSTCMHHVHCNACHVEEGVKLQCSLLC